MFCTRMKETRDPRAPSHVNPGSGTRIGPYFGPELAHFQAFFSGSKTGHRTKNTCPGIPMDMVSFLENAFLIPFGPVLVPKKPMDVFFWAKTGHRGFKTGENYVFEHPKRSGNDFGKNHF